MVQGQGRVGGYNGEEMGRNRVPIMVAGGGATDIRIGGTDLSDRVLVAAGGGGGGFNWDLRRFAGGGLGWLYVLGELRRYWRNSNRRCWRVY
jgi:hypothetical protein